MAKAGNGGGEVEATRETGVDAAVMALSLELDGIFTLIEEQRTAPKTFQ